MWLAVDVRPRPAQRHPRFVNSPLQALVAHTRVLGVVRQRRREVLEVFAGHPTDIGSAVEHHKEVGGAMPDGQVVWQRGLDLQWGGRLEQGRGP